MSDVWTRLHSRIREISREEAKTVAPAVQRATVIDGHPLAVDLDGHVLHIDDEDVEADKGLIDTPPSPGDVVRVHQDTHGDYVIGGIING